MAAVFHPPSRLREEFKEQEPWTNLTYILDNTGRMKIHYGYDDLSEMSPVEKQEKWENEYLN
ncbi:immunity protein YezG family protein [Caldibacillus thermoamylovorans]